MSTKRIIMLTAVLALVLVSFAFAEVCNDTCPVMGGKIDKDTPYTAEYNGKTIGFCCPDCIEAFKADPEKHMAKLETKCMIKCPECGAEIDVKKECAKQGAACPTCGGCK